MKKTILFSAALVAVVACGPKKTNAELTEEFNASYEAIIEEYRTVMESGELSESQVDSLVNATQAKLNDLALGTIKKHSKDSVALSALASVQYELSTKELSEIIDGLGENLKQTEFVQGLLKGLEAKLNTDEGKMFTDFTIVQDESDPDGSTVKFSDYVGKGKWVLVDFWASWCGPCKKEIPNIASVYEKYAGENFDVLSIAVWDKPEATKQAAEEHGVVWSQIINAQKIPTDIYGIDGIPHIMLVAPDGKIYKRNLRGSDIEAAVAEALGR